MNKISNFFTILEICKEENEKVSNYKLPLDFIEKKSLFKKKKRNLQIKNGAHY